MAPRNHLDSEPVIDLVHLARQTMSDQALEVELLELFDLQSARIVAQLIDSGAIDAKLCGDLAHKLKGSALAIGAGRVARSAAAYEVACSSGATAPVAEVAEAVEEARAAIGRLLG